MNIGDLVRYKDRRWIGWYGIIVDQNHGTARMQTVKWNKHGVLTSSPAYALEIISYASSPIKKVFSEQT